MSNDMSGRSGDGMIPVLPLIGLASAALWAVLTFAVLTWGFPATFMGIGLLALAMFALSRVR